MIVFVFGFQTEAVERLMLRLVHDPDQRLPTTGLPQRVTRFVNKDVLGWEVLIRYHPLENGPEWMMKAVRSPPALFRAGTTGQAAAYIASFMDERRHLIQEIVLHTKIRMLSGRQVEFLVHPHHTWESFAELRRSADLSVAVCPENFAGSPEVLRWLDGALYVVDCDKQRPTLRIHREKMTARLAPGARVFFLDNQRYNNLPHQREWNAFIASLS